MNTRIQKYIDRFKLTLSFSEFSWWIIDYKNEPEYFYCNDLMCETFLLDKSITKHSIEKTCPIAGDYVKNVKLASSKKAKQIIKEYLELLNKKRKEFNNTFPYYNPKNKEINYFSSRAKVLEFDENNEVSIFFGIIENISQEKIQAKKNQEYTQIIDKYVMTSTTDIYGNIISISEAFCNITGYTKEELIGKKHSLLKHPDTKKDKYIKMWKQLSSGKVWKGEYKNLKKDGSTYWIKLVVTPIFDENGTIKAYTTINEDITDKKIIEKLSIKDKLTDIYNRAKLDDLLQLEFLRAKRYKNEFSIIILDIDFFKSVNDKYGHLEGDRVLINFANILKSQTRKTDFVGRWGGEEFLIICPNTNINQAQSAANKLRKKIEDFDFELDLNITASFGVTSYKQNDDIDDMLKRADTVLYYCKNAGRNRVEVSI